MRNQFVFVSNLIYVVVLTVVLPPEKAEGCESYLQYLHSEDGEREILRDATKAPGKKRISLDVRVCNYSTSCREVHVHPMLAFLLLLLLLSSGGLEL